MNTNMIPDGMTTGAVEGTQQPTLTKDVSPGVNQATGATPASVPGGNGLDQDSTSQGTVSPTPPDRRLERALRKWAAVLSVPCTSSVCLNEIGNLCTFGDGRFRLTPHQQRITAARLSGAYRPGQRVPAVVQG